MVLMHQEIEVWYVLPALRRELVKSLVRKYRMAQKDVAEMLGITKAAVSQYLKDKRAKEVVLNAKILKEIEKSAGRLYNKGSSIMRELNLLSEMPLVKQVVCKYHKMKCGGLHKCNVCFEK